MMLCSGLSSTLLLAATCSLITSGFIRAQVSFPSKVTPISTGRVVTSNGLSVHRLSCVGGMIIVRSAEYRCGGGVTWSHSDAVNNVRNSCDGKTECDIKSNITYDPGVCKYLETTYDCFPRQSVICEGSQANLQCDEGQVIVVSWANYGRRDTTTCPGKYTIENLNNVNCFWSGSMNYVTTRCNGTNSCTVEAKSSQDPCGGIYKYLEVFYTCQTPSCPAGWTWFGGRCFIFKSSMKNWTDAESSCQTLGGNLASFHSTAEYTFIRELTRTAAGSYTRAWVGGNDRETETVWKWSDGSQFDFTNWGNGQPDNSGGGEDCMEINFNGDYVNDQRCNSQRGFVCVRGP
ncbi:L-rhamnose-binding lectin SML-like [Astatotilapia calliptera]|uniref:C-type lectin domain-containing protein n=1 Tax=Astatotilapia calliptera TaxID=8154 RepID=A0A3P8PAV1_ASTCA|nr:L-rhamnose-binding lectin SML-like [Astatotilapia calliptera]